MHPATARIRHANFAFATKPDTGPDAWHGHRAGGRPRLVARNAYIGLTARRPSSHERLPMPPNIKRVFYVNNVAAPVFLDILATRRDIQVDRLENDSPDSEADPILARAHIYQIGSSRQELAMKFQ